MSNGVADELVWYGNAPDEWFECRIKDIACLSPPLSQDKPDEFELCTVVPMESVTELGEIDTSQQQPFIDVSDGLPNFETGDVLFAKITPCMENGKGAFVENTPTRYAFGSTEFHVLRPSWRIDGRYLYYYTFNPIYRNYAEANMTGAAGQKRASSKFLKYTRIFLPKIDEQIRIAQYLDQTCVTIDRAIFIKQQQLEKLEQLRKSMIYKAVTKGLDDEVEMRESGVEWIGEVPLHWKKERIKNIVKLSPRCSGTKPTDDEFCTVVPMEAVSEEGVIQADNSEMSINISNGLTLFENGDVIIAKITPCMENGKGAYVENIPTRYAFGSTEFHVLRPASRINARFLYYYTYNSSFRDYAEKNMTGAAGQKRVSSKFLKCTPIYLPSVEDQEKIVDFIDAELMRTKTLRETISKQVGTLMDYKNSLIHECVTGKRCITEADLRQVA